MFSFESLLDAQIIFDKIIKVVFIEEAVLFLCGFCGLLVTVISKKIVHRIPLLLLRLLLLQVVLDELEVGELVFLSISLEPALVLFLIIRRRITIRLRRRDQAFIIITDDEAVDHIFVLLLLGDLLIFLRGEVVVFLICLLVEEFGGGVGHAALSLRRGCYGLCSACARALRRGDGEAAQQRVLRGRP